MKRLKNCTVYLNARFDLYQGHGGDEKEFAKRNGFQIGSDQAREAFIEDFEAAYSAAAKSLGKKIGVEIAVDTPPLSQYGGCPGGHVESEEWARECELWQSLHDCVYWDADDCEWGFSVSDELVRKIRHMTADE